MLSPRRQNMLLLPLAFSILCVGRLGGGSAFTPSTRTAAEKRRLPRSLGISGHLVNENTSASGLLFSKAGSDDDLSRPNIVKIETHQDYVNFLEEDDRLCLVKFYAGWCKSCKRFGISFRQLAYEEGDHINLNGDSIVHSGNVRFAEVEYTQNARLCKSLKVKKLPTVHYYKRGKGKLSELTCKPSQFQLVVDQMNNILAGNVVEEDEVVIAVVGDDGEGREREAITTSSFDQALANLSQEIMETIQRSNQTSITSGRQEKNPWFPF